MTPFEMESPERAEGGEFLDWLEERDRSVMACAARPSGHRWKVEAELGEEPCLSCEDCPAGADDVMPDLPSILAYHDTAETIGAHEVHWGRPLADDAEPYTIPVSIDIESITRMSDYGTEHDVEVHITVRGGEAS